MESHELDQNRLEKGGGVEKRVTPASDFPQQIAASASDLRSIGSFDGNHEQDVEPEPVDMTTSSSPAGTIISAPEASPAICQS
jgi:hypothetical protein